MAQLELYGKTFEKLEASLVFIAAEKSGGLFNPKGFLEKHPASFPFLLDEDRNVTKTYGVYVRLKMDSFNIARPATFVVDRAGTIRFLYAGESQTDRVDIQEVVNVLERIRQAR